MRILVGIFLLIVISGRLILPWFPIDWLLANALLDDGFYYFKTAKNIAAGLGSTFDGEYSTNGYHPLWMVLSIIIYSVTGESLTLPLHILLTLSTLFDIGTAYVIFRIIGLWTTQPALRWGALFLYLLNPYQIQASLNGLETGLALFLLSLLLFFTLRAVKESPPTSYVDVVGSASSPVSLMDALWVGVIGGLVTLARLEYGFFVVAAALTFLILKRSFKAFILVGLTSLLIFSPWVIWSWSNFGTPISIAGLAYTFTTKTLWYYKPRPWWHVPAWSLFQGWKGVILTLRQTALFPVVALACFLAIAWVWKKRRNLTLFLSRPDIRQPFIVLLFFLSAFAIIFAIHALFRWTPRPWYFLSFNVLWVVGATFFLTVTQPGWLKKKFALLSVAVLILSSYSFAAWRLNGTNEQQKDMLRAAYWIRDTLPPEARIAAWNSGIIGYFSNHFVLNADGLVNAAGYRAMREHRVWNFLKEAKITHIVDYEVAIRYRHRPVLGVQDPFRDLEVIRVFEPRGRTYANSQIHAYRFVPHE